jgi:hypothetical protein
MGQHLVDGAPGHDIAGQEQRDRVTIMPLRCPGRFSHGVFRCGQGSSQRCGYGLPDELPAFHGGHDPVLHLSPLF